MKILKPRHVRGNYFYVLSCIATIKLPLRRSVHPSPPH